ncbi:uncharacterized protein LOC115218684 [Argonauta hians]
MMASSAAVVGCYAECKSSRCSQLLTSDEYLSCLDYNACLLNKEEGGCTMEERNDLLPVKCRCYVGCSKPFRDTINSRQTHYCYYRGQLQMCMSLNADCYNVPTYLLKDFKTKCPCKVDNCLQSPNRNVPGNFTCVKYLNCLSGGPVSNLYAGCASVQQVRKAMQIGNRITNPQGTWILDKNCRCVNSCAKEQLEYWPGCGPSQRLARCYLEHSCSIEHLKPNLVPCACEEVCKTEIRAVLAVANNTIDLLCKNYRNYGKCLRKYGCGKRDLRMDYVKRLDECSCFQFCNAGSRESSFLNNQLGFLFCLLLLFTNSIVSKF